MMDVKYAGKRYSETLLAKWSESPGGAPVPAAPSPSPPCDVCGDTKPGLRANVYVQGREEKMCLECHVQYAAPSTYGQKGL